MLSKSKTPRVVTNLGGTVRSVAVMLALMPGIAVAQTGGPIGIRQSPPIALATDTAHLIQLPAPAKTVFVANPDIADIQVANPTSVLVYGKKPGTTTVFAISDTGITSSYSITVSRPTGELIAALHREVPSAQVTAIATPDGITLNGHVRSPVDAEKLRSVAKQFLGDKQSLNFEVVVDASTQVMLRVMVAEVDRNVTRAFGVNWDQLFGSNALAVAVLSGAIPLAGAAVATASKLGLNYSINANTLIDALNQEGLAHILAEPTIMATSGDTANFLAGGEFPIPIPQGNQTVTVAYKQYGISVDFTPTVLDGNNISIKVRPEVSQLTSVGGLSLNNVAIPALTTRRVETTVELGSGQSFAIAGLFQNTGTNQIKGVPGLADTPILGALFRSSTFQRNESELVIIVTPFIVRPVDRVSDLHLPTEGFQFSSEIGRILEGRVAASHPRQPAPAGRALPVPHLSGAAGFIME